MHYRGHATGRSRRAYETPESRRYYVPLQGPQVHIRIALELIPICTAFAAGRASYTSRADIRLAAGGPIYRVQPSALLVVTPPVQVLSSMNALKPLELLAFLARVSWRSVNPVNLP